MNRSLRESRYVLLRVLLTCGFVLTGLAAGLQAATYHVAQTAAASDSSVGQGAEARRHGADPLGRVPRVGGDRRDSGPLFRRV